MNLLHRNKFLPRRISSLTLSVLMSSVLTNYVSVHVVSRTVPDFIENQEAPTVSYTYTKTISSKIFNFKNAIKNIDFDVGTSDMTCKCSSSAFNYTPAGHVVTGDLNIIEARPLRQLLMKGPAFREQNNINWELNVRRLLGNIRKSGLGETV